MHVPPNPSVYPFLSVDYFATKRPPRAVLNRLGNARGRDLLHKAPPIAMERAGVRLSPLPHNDEPFNRMTARESIAALAGALEASPDAPEGTPYGGFGVGTALCPRRRQDRK